jgi:hypothetical protein
MHSDLFLQAITISYIRGKLKNNIDTLMLAPSAKKTAFSGLGEDT